MKDPWYKNYFDNQPKATKDVYDTKHWENQYYSKQSSSWGNAWPAKTNSPYGGGPSNPDIRKRVIIQGVVSLLILVSVYTVARGDGSLSVTVKDGLNQLLAVNDYQPALTQMVRMGLETENVDWPILNELRGNQEQTKAQKENTTEDNKSQENKSNEDNTQKAGDGQGTAKNGDKSDSSNQGKSEEQKDSTDEKDGTAQKVNTESLQFSFPMSGKIIKEYGWVKDDSLGVKKFHDGIDIQGKVGDSVKSIGKGEVITIGVHKELGKYILIEYPDKIIALYAQIGNVKVKEGDKVLEGQVISTVAKSSEGKVDHLHLEIRKDGEAVNPIETLGLQ